MPETILIVDDEESVRRTFLDWLTTSNFGCDVHAVADAESALVFANRHPVDLAILDWNLGTGSDGLKLLEDLVEFRPDIVAILVTGFAHQATPLDALRMGVRDYLDKNHDLNRETFLGAVRHQLTRIVPAKRQREFSRGLLAFREAVEKVLPLVQSSAALNDPVPLPDAIRSLFRFLIQSTRASDGVLIARHIGSDGKETFLAFGSDGRQLERPAVPFARSLAASVLSLGEPSAMNLLDAATVGPVELQAFEKNRKNLLAAPIEVGPGTHVVLELFDKQTASEFTEEDRRLVAAASDFGGELLRQALAERQTRKTLFDAVEAALKAGESIAETLPATTEERLEEPPPAAVMDRLKESLRVSGGIMDPDSSLRLAEAVRVLAVRHGPAAVKHCIVIVESLRRTLDEITGS
jgi:ActR/RegA family two-component response regulator